MCDKIKTQLLELLSEFFHIGNSYHYTLGRDKEAFAIGTMEIDDFKEYGEEEVAEIADYLATNGVTIQRWIPVTERMPVEEDFEEQENYKCLVVVRRYNLFDFMKYKDRVTHAYWTGDYFFDGHNGWGGGKMNNVTHWMPLPDPPTKEKEDEM